MKLLTGRIFILIPGIIVLFSLPVFAQKPVLYKDSIIYKIIYKDTIIYNYDTVRINRYIRSDTLWNPAKQASRNPKRKMLDTNSWGIGPSIGAYYSPFNGFDINIGFGIQYYFFSIPSFRNPHSGHRRKGR